MCKFMDSDCYCVVISDTCNQKSCELCEAYKEEVNKSINIKE